MKKTTTTAPMGKTMLVKIASTNSLTLSIFVTSGLGRVDGSPPRSANANMGKTKVKKTNKKRVMFFSLFMDLIVTNRF